ncbi:MAG: arylmalonate decarboxylase, partial [Chloroflexota bacterium]|nr:arylmalonate decarboxylase [Chloroflexota bacterium]
MPDKLGWRANWGVIAPSTNTSVQPEFDEMRPRGVTNHMSRIFVPDEPLNSDEDFNRLMDAIRLEWDNAILRVMTCNPDYLVMGMSSETFWGGLERANELKSHMTGMTGLGVAMGSDACQAAIRCYGDIKKIGVLTPYWPVADKNVTLFFNDCGFNVVALKGLCCPGPAAIAQTTEEEMMNGL